LKRIRNLMGRNFRRQRNPDTLSIKKRSTLMSRVRSKNTSFEKQFFKLLKQTVPIKFKTHVTFLVGKPDVVFDIQKVCLFVDSDFWHGWQYPRWKHLLKNDFWRNKIERNRKRDMAVSRYLRSAGWKVIRIWEHQLKLNPSLVIKKIIEVIGD